MARQIEQKIMTGKTGLILILMLSVVLFSSYVSAFGIGSAYHKDYPLELSIGETKDINFNLQNGPGPDNITARPSVGKGSEIMEIIDSGDIFVPIGGSVNVRARVSIPNDAKVGDVYSVEITFTTITKGESGTFGFGSSVGKSFDVIVVPTAEERARLAEQKPISSWIIYLIVGIIILIVVIWFIFKRGKK